MTLYSIKMRASQKEHHVSGAERILEKKQLASAVGTLTERALQHSLGTADFINLKIEEISEEAVLRLPALPVTTKPSQNIEDSFSVMASMLNELGITNPDKLITLLRNVKPMRGAVLYDIATNQRIDPNQERGIRVTYMDATDSDSLSSNKNHFREALVLATKVVNTPGMVAELCISDDPDYVTGYLASKKHGYTRIMPLKNVGDPHGGRIFIFDSRQAKPEEAIHFLEKVPVLVDSLPTEKITIEAPEISINNKLDELKKNALFRSMRTMNSEQSKYAIVNEKKQLLMSSNSYLDLAANPRVKEAAARAVLLWGAGSGGSRLTTGNTALAEELEKALAKFKRKEATLLFNTGYMANVGIISALTDKESVIFSDEFNHASIIDGSRLSGAKIIVYKHNDMQDLETKIVSTQYRKGLIVSDAVFSMDGDIANLPEIVKLSQKYHLLSMLDEAHATGVIGANGQGIVEYFNYTAEPDIIMGTLSKSLGSEGGFACASNAIINYLINKARSFIFSTAQCPAALGAALEALKLIEEDNALVKQLQHNVDYFCACLRRQGINANSPTPIIPIIIGDEAKAMSVAKELENEGVLIPAIRYPTVPKGTARLRVALMATHTDEELEHTAHLISKAIKKYQ